MLHVFHKISVNDQLAPGEPKLTRSQVWKGLLMKAENALPFVAAMSRCEVIERGENWLLREVDLPGETARERITLYPEKTVVFSRLSGKADGIIVNEILGEGENLELAFSFALQLKDAQTGSAAELEMRQKMEGAYRQAVASTLAAIRKMVLEEVSRA